MKTSSVHHPAKNPYIQLFDWQIKFCCNNHCAALLLSYFIAWHDWKLRNDSYYRSTKAATENSQDDCQHDEHGYLFFTADALIDGCMGLYGKKAIADGLAVLESLGVITVHKNPNARYRFDKTKYFRFFPSVCNRWIKENYTDKSDNDDMIKMPDRTSENVLSSGKNGRPCGRNGNAITDTTSNTTNNTQSINAYDIDCLIKLLIKKGMPEWQVKSADDLSLLRRLVQLGATPTIIDRAYDLSSKATVNSGKKFGLRYLAKVIENLIRNTRCDSVKNVHAVKPMTAIYENDFHGGLSWMGDIAI